MVPDFGIIHLGTTFAKSSKKLNVMLCTIWYNLKKVKNTHGGVLLLVTLQTKACNFATSSTPPSTAIFHVFQAEQMVPNRATHHKC